VLQIEEELNVVSNLLAYYFRAFWSFVESLHDIKILRFAINMYIWNNGYEV
jgi:hypothetical protein